MLVTDITGTRLKEALQRIHGSPGLDAWRVSELKGLHQVFLSALADVLNIIERTEPWPQALLSAGTTLIDKGAGAKSLDLRPITVMSTIYRLCALVV